MSCSVRALLCLFALSWTVNVTAPRAADVDVEIVLAVDASGSVDRSELQLQLDGIAAAFRDSTVQSAIMEAPLRRIIVSMLIWSDAAFEKHATDWYLVESAATAEAFALRVETFRDITGGVFAIGGGGTGLGDGLAHALGMIEANGIEATRRIVDISGDGIETKPWSEGAVELPEARAAAASGAVTVNGLAIVNEVPALADWYRRNVMVGAGSFVMETGNFRDYRNAIRMKLLRELSAIVIGRAEPGGERAQPTTQ